MTKHHTLGPRTEQVLAYIRLFISQQGRAPGYDEIARGVGMKTSSVVAYHLRLLERQGLIELGHDGPRSIRLLPAAEALPVLRYAALKDALLDLHGVSALEAVARLVQLFPAETIAQAAHDCERTLGGQPKLGPGTVGAEFILRPEAALAEATNG